jgi:hypothetical protein
MSCGLRLVPRQATDKHGETLHNNLILANVYKRGIQKVEFTIKKK